MQITSTRPFGISGIHLKTDFVKNAQAQREFLKDSVFALRKPNCMKRAGRCCLRKRHIFDAGKRQLHGLDLTFHFSRLLPQFMLSSFCEAVIGLVQTGSPRIFQTLRHPCYWVITPRH